MMSTSTDATARPTPIPVDPRGIPADLKARPQWVLWQYELRDGNWTKSPYQPNGHHAMSADGKKPQGTARKTWSAFDVVLTAYKNTPGRWAGVGYVFAADDPYVGIDLDRCLDPATGTLAPWAADTLRDIDSYCETSPSGCGLKVWLCGKLPPDAQRHRRDGLAAVGAMPPGEIEVYEHGRYFAVTGNLFPGAAREIRDCQEALTAWYRRTFRVATKPSSNGHATAKDGLPAQPQHTKPVTKAPDDDEIILAGAGNSINGPKFDRLWAGDTRGYGSASEADAALAAILAFHCGPDAPRIERLMKRSRLVRPKWDERRGSGTYLSVTVASALAQQTEFRDWSKSIYHDAQPEDKDLDDRTRHLKILARALREGRKIPDLIDVIKRGATKARYELVFRTAGGDIHIDIGDAERVFLPWHTQAAVADAGVGVVPRSYKKDEWFRYAKLIFGVARMIETTTTEEKTREWLASFVLEFEVKSRTAVKEGMRLETDDSWIDTQEFRGFIDEATGDFFVSAPALAKYIRDVWKTQIVDEEVAQRLSRLNFRKERLQVKVRRWEGKSTVRSLRFWVGRLATDELQTEVEDDRDDR